MSNRQNGIVDNWKEEARKSSLPVFPIRIKWNGNKWDKIPLCRNGVLDASYNVDVHDWSHANGYGIAMGEKSGLYALDIDSYKEGCDADAWIDAHGVVRETRTHTTISGGRHMIFSLLGEYKQLPSRANIVQGLDSRGQGGFIAFGEGYEMVDDRLPVILGREACEEIIDGHSGQGGGGAVVLQAYAPPKDTEKILARLNMAVMKNQKLRMRWLGRTDGLADKSGSAMDHSVSKLLNVCGFSYDEVVWIILNVFEHGSARAKGDWRVAMRAAGRSAVKADISTQEEIAMTTLWEDQEMLSDDDEASLLEAIRNGA